MVPAGHKVQVLAPWGTPILEGAPAYAPGAVTGAAPAGQVGTHHDDMHFFPVEGSSTDCLPVINHEYAAASFFQAAQWAGQALDSHAVVTDADCERVEDEVLAEINGHGVSVLHIRRGANGQWAVVQDVLNLRITGATEMAIAGPAPGEAKLVTKFAPDDSVTRGTLNNCAHGVTARSSSLTAEENWAGYFVNTGEQPREHDRPDAPDDETRYRWDLAASGADEFVRLNATATGADATQDYRNAPNIFGWIVEIAPFDPASTPVKRCYHGRLANEGVVLHASQADTPVVRCWGDDWRLEYVYKLAAAAPSSVGARGEIRDTGTL